MRECGLKQSVWEKLYFAMQVTPHAGVWIETMRNMLLHLDIYKSLPMRECGLKHGVDRRERPIYSHSPCGSVD